MSIDVYTKEQSSLLIVSDYEDAAEVPEAHRLTTVVDGEIRPAIGVDSTELLLAADRYDEYLLFCDQVDDIADGLTCPPAPYSGHHVVVSGAPRGTLEAIGLVERSITMTTENVWSVLQPDPWEGDEFHSHGVPLATLKRLPLLLERPTLIANSKDDRTKLVLVLNATDNRGMPLIAPMKADAKGRLDMERFTSDLICTLFGPDDFFDYFGAALKEDDVIYIDSQQENELNQMIGREAFSNYGKLERDEVLHPAIRVGPCPLFP